MATKFTDENTKRVWTTTFDQMMRFAKEDFNVQTAIDAADLAAKAYEERFTTSTQPQQ